MAKFAKKNRPGQRISNQKKKSFFLSPFNSYKMLSSNFWNAAGEVFVNTILRIETFAIFVYAMPYTMKMKVSVVEKVATSNIMEMLRQGAYLPFAVILTALYRKEMDLVKKERIKFALLLLFFLKRSHDRITESELEFLIVADQISEERAFLNFQPPTKLMTQVCIYIYIYTYMKCCLIIKKHR